MEVSARKTDDLVVLSPVGSLDTRSAVDFEKSVLDCLGQGLLRFVIDFGRVDVVSSAGLRVLIMLDKRLAGTGGGVVLTGLSDHVRMVFEVTALADHFTITASEQEAIARLRAGRVAPGPRLSLERQLADRIAGTMGIADDARGVNTAGQVPSATLRVLADRLAAILAKP